LHHLKSGTRANRRTSPRRRSRYHASLKRERTESSSHYKVIFNSVGDAILIHEIGGRFLEANRIACERLGYDRKELLRMTPVDIDYTKSRELVAKRVDEVRKLGHTFIETAHVSRDGTVFPVELSSRIIKYKGRPAVLSIARDITQRKHVEEASDRLAAIVESSDEAIVGKTLDGLITSWNRGAEKLYGYSSEEVKGKPISILIPPNRPDELTQILERVKRGETVQRYETRRMRKDGKIIYVSLGVSPIRDATGAIVGASTIARDVTRRKQAEEALRVSEMKYRTLFENIPLGIYQTSPEGKLLTANPALVHLLGYESETELLAVNVDTDTYANPEDRKRWMRQLETHGEVHDAELVLRRKDGRELTVLDNAHLLRDDQGVVLYHEGSLTDITERKRAEEVVRQTEERFHRAMEATSDGLWDWNVETGEMYFSPAYYQMLGYEPGELPGLKKTWMDLIHPDDRDQALRSNQECIENRIPNFKVEFRMKTKTGEWKWILGRGRASVRGSNGRALQMIGTHVDITERKQMEEKLRLQTEALSKSEERFRGIAERSFDAIITVDLDGRIAYASPAAIRITGYREDELLGAPMQKFLPDSEIPNLMRIFSDAMTGKAEESVELNILKNDGSIACLEFHGSPVAKDGELIGFEAIARDITERKQMEEDLRRYSEHLQELVTERTAKLQESEERFRSIAERNFDTIFTTDMEGQIAYVSPAVENIFGYSPVEVVGKRLQSFLIEDQIPNLREAFAALRSGENIGGFETQGYRKDRSIAHVEINAAPVVKDGNVVGMQGIARDITERKRAEMAIRAAGERLQYVITSNPAAIFTGKPRADLSDYEVTYMSNRITDMLGFEPERFVGHPEFWENRIHPDDLRRYSVEIPVLWKKGQYAFEYRFLHKDGTYRWIREEAKIVRDADSKPTEVMGYWTDVTERKQMEEKLVNSERLSAIGETVMMVGHDLRNPMQVMVNSLSLWEEICNSMPPEYRQLSDKLGVNKLLERTERQLEYMNKIVSDLQDYARPVKPELTRVDILEFAKETLSTIQIPPNIDVSMKSDKSDVKAMFDPAMMKRVLTNLVTNAIQAMPNGGALRIAISTTGDSASIDVADTGVGVPEENVAKLFQPLFTTKPKGQGLGLPVCKRLVEAHGGNIKVKSRVGEGTTFTVSLPLK
jgi:PAS domain S-box-containing protein